MSDKLNESTVVFIAANILLVHTRGVSDYNIYDNTRPYKTVIRIYHAYQYNHF